MSGKSDKWLTNYSTLLLLDAQNAASLPRRCRVDSWDPHGVLKDLLIKIIVFVYVIVICNDSECNQSLLKNNGAALTRKRCGSGATFCACSICPFYTNKSYVLQCYKSKVIFVVWPRRFLLHKLSRQFVTLISLSFCYQKHQEVIDLGACIPVLLFSEYVKIQLVLDGFFQFFASIKSFFFTYINY
jgi:hypothetical protein